MHHTLAFTADLVTATLTELTPVPDQIIPIANGRFLPPDDLLLMGGIGYGTNLQRARFRSPSLVQVNPSYIRPIQASLVGANDANAYFFDRSPLKMKGQEEIVLEAIQNAGANQRITVIAHVATRLTTPPAGNVFVIRATSTTAAVVNVWSPIVYALETALPAGRYAVCLIECASTNGQAVRATYDNQFYRPGYNSLNANLSRLPYQYYEYWLGVAGYFETFSLPRLEVLCNVADAAHEIYFHLVPMSGAGARP